VLVFRFTDIFQKTNGNWLVTREHRSVPADPVTGNADFLSQPQRRKAMRAYVQCVNLTLWQPKGGGDVQMALALTANPTTHEIATVKGSEPRGG
jgi:hypothetical protein